MALTLTWSIEGEKQLSRKLRSVVDSIGDLKAPFEKSAKELESIFSSTVFTSRGSIIGESWKPLSPVTIAQKARSGYPNPSQPLVATGRMKDSFDHKSAKDHAIIFNDTEYFKYHQSNKPRSRLPRRVMMKLGEQQRQLVVRNINEHLKKAL